MHFERITDAKHPMYQTAMELYRQSFPLHEQRETSSQEDILRHTDYHFTLCYDESLFTGLVLYWETADFLYVEHFCILPELRSRHYGQHILEELVRYGKTIILEIDPPADEISVRRKGFYERCGFVENPYPHIHPPYHKGSSGHTLVVMSCPEKISSKEYALFRGYLNDKVMRDVF